MKKKRSLTESERDEVKRLCFSGRLGTATMFDAERSTELYTINPEEYGEICKVARRAADKTMNPMACEDDS